jgi:hypothetical protein
LYIPDNQSTSVLHDLQEFKLRSLEGAGDELASLNQYFDIRDFKVPSSA